MPRGRTILEILNFHSMSDNRSIFSLLSSVATSSPTFAQPVSKQSTSVIRWMLLRVVDQGLVAGLKHKKPSVTHVFCHALELETLVSRLHCDF